jgi:hypothetical protein
VRRPVASGVGDEYQPPVRVELEPKQGGRNGPVERSAEVSVGRLAERVGQGETTEDGAE